MGASSNKTSGVAMDSWSASFSEAVVVPRGATLSHTERPHPPLEGGA